MRDEWSHIWEGQVEESVIVILRGELRTGRSGPALVNWGEAVGVYEIFDRGDRRYRVAGVEGCLDRTGSVPERDATDSDARPMQPITSLRRPVVRRCRPEHAPQNFIRAEHSNRRTPSFPWISEDERASWPA
jgi:hypothetical protein